MTMSRRGFLGSILAASVAPAIVRAQSLMPVRPLGALILPGSGQLSYRNAGSFGPYDAEWRERKMQNPPRFAFAGNDSDMIHCITAPYTQCNVFDGAGWQLVVL